MPDKPQSARRISEESVLKATGQGWSHWFTLLDNWGAKDKPHKEITKYLHDKHNLSDWWSQMVTVEYERERGLREVHERKSGFAVDVSRVIAAPPEKAWAAWADPTELSRWFTTGAQQDFRVGGRFSNNDGDSGTFKRIVPGKIIVFTWESKHHQPGSQVTIQFTSKSDGRVNLSLAHEKLKTQKDANDLKEGWSWALDCLKLYLETGNTIGFEEWVSQRTPE